MFDVDQCISWENHLSDFHLEVSGFFINYSSSSELNEKKF